MSYSKVVSHSTTAESTSSHPSDKFDYLKYSRNLNLGCGYDIRSGYLNVDFHTFVNPDLVADIRNLDMLPSGFYDEIIAQDCLEHFPRCDTEPALSEWSRLLKPGGVLKLRVPNLIGLLELFSGEERQSIKDQKTLVQCLFGTQACEGDWHLTGFTQLLLEHYLENAGFFKIEFVTKDCWLFDVTCVKNDVSSGYVYRPKTVSKSFSDSMAELKKLGFKVVDSAIDNTSPSVVLNILTFAREAGISFGDYEISLDGYKEHFDNAEYTIRYPNYYLGNQIEKSLEHYIAFSLLNLNAKDVFVDIASEHSPVPEIYARLSGATTYSQDIMYSPGINGSRIGGDACSMPVPNEFASKATLTCSLEHFEADSDIRLFDELYRVLKPGGIVCVVPFYVFEEPATQTDPTVSVASGVVFDRDTTIYCAQGWGNRHGRFYSPKSLLERIIKPVEGKFKFDFYHLKNAAEVDPSVYVRFAFTATRL